ncbi:phosphonate C-P lyase system protein PhnG [Devosia neptuniae]|uniref:Phosphonate C-P lyase system protein PhnG n=1 Tax=Devosia neptuniae TaxID=191302 RepID=A0ABY6CCU0_9HYPH|nr:phosphonate C-P lyase system protein PhnG [Devosia neptuniae]UXN69970.1 phosphonate C-P lyase system protein PhnG [Devosia neptuniae]
MTTEPRRLALNALAAAESAALTARWSDWAEKPEFRALRGPETGLVMVRGRAGGGGAPFNLGETSVSRASVRLASGEVGHGYCLGRDLEKARLIAVFDALFQREPERVEAEVLAPLRAVGSHADQQKREEAAATKVDFFTMVRGDV